MIHTWLFWCIIAAAIGIGGQVADGITTYIGVKKAGPGIEGDKSALAQWLVHNPFLLPWFKASICAAILAVIIWAGPYTNDGGYFMSLVSDVIMAGMGYSAAYSNYKTNKNLK